MSCLKKLIQKKRIKPLIGIFIIFLLGLFCLLTGLYDCLIQDRFYYSQTYTFSLPGTTRLLSYSAIGRILLGMLVIYLSLWNLPRWSSDSQAKEDYRISFNQDYVDIYFQKWHWHLKKETLSPYSFFFFDTNHRFVSPVTGYQVYNAIMAFYPEAFGLMTIHTNQDSHHDQIYNFEHIRNATQEETDTFIKTTEKTRHHIFGKLCAVFLIGASLSFIPYLKNISEVWGIILFIIFIFIVFILGIKLFRACNFDLNIGRWIRSHGLSAAKGYSYAHYKSSNDEGIHYFIKVWDGTQVYLPQWFPVDKKIYMQPETCPLTLYYYKDSTGAYQIEFISLDIL